MPRIILVRGKNPIGEFMPGGVNIYCFVFVKKAFVFKAVKRAEKRSVKGIMSVEQGIRVGKILFIQRLGENTPRVIIVSLIVAAQIV